MEFLREVLGEKFDEFAGRINDYNSNNPDKSIKLANLAGGGYVDKDKYASLKTRYEKEAEKLKAEVENVKKEYAVELALTGEKPKNMKALKALLDLDAVSYENGVLSGLSQQLEVVRRENGFLFEDSEPKPIFTRSLGSSTGELTREQFKGLSYMEKLRLKKEEPETYSKLKQEE